eukprot:TRINITY_DN39794_c0_g1_i1.p1 TRINITY_DN39794_c0_g1~~TRINITY_DN39794_c0_g1_i1.p1  ORF type:complete len:273 (-),score=44.85 TRINITY_DN39794_c0_g1_i1:378-1196(-)
MTAVFADCFDRAREEEEWQAHLARVKAEKNRTNGPPAGAASRSHDSWMQEYGLRISSSPSSPSTRFLGAGYGSGVSAGLMAAPAAGAMGSPRGFGPPTAAGAGRLPRPDTTPEMKLDLGGGVSSARATIETEAAGALSLKGYKPYVDKSASTTRSSPSLALASSHASAVAASRTARVAAATSQDARGSVAMPSRPQTPRELGGLAKTWEASMATGGNLLLEASHAGSYGPLGVNMTSDRSSGQAHRQEALGWRLQALSSKLRQDALRRVRDL